MMAWADVRHHYDEGPEDYPPPTPTTHCTCGAFLPRLTDADVEYDYQRDQPAFIGGPLVCKRCKRRWTYDQYWGAS